jgi:hypothetical protein
MDSIVSTMQARLFFLLLIVAASAGVYALREGYVVVPDRWNPWAPVRIDEPLHWLTRFKLERLSKDDAMCLAVLGQAQMRYEPVADRETGPGCGFDNAVRVLRTSASVGTPFTLSCRSAVALAKWERHILQPAARSHFGASVVRLEHFGSYACRNVYDRKNAPVSRHATADALDVAGFVLSNAQHVRVERDWGDGGAAGAFLREVRDGACRVFDSVLGPDYNAAHRDHFHLDRGGWRSCR